MKAMARQRSHSIEFKRQVAQEFIAGESLYALSKRHDISRQLIRVWVQKYEAGALDEDAQAADLLQEYEAKIAALERMVGRQALEIEFLKGALKNAPRPRNVNTSAIWLRFGKCSRPRCWRRRSAMVISGSTIPSPNTSSSCNKAATSAKSPSGNSPRTHPACCCRRITRRGRIGATRCRSSPTRSTLGRRIGLPISGISIPMRALSYCNSPSSAATPCQSTG